MNRTHAYATAVMGLTRLNMLISLSPVCNYAFGRGRVVRHADKLDGIGFMWV